MTREMENLIRRMNEAASLDADDPFRQAVVQEVLACGPQAERQWLALVRENEALCLAMRRIDPSPQLREALLRIPGEQTGKIGRSSGGRQARGMGRFGSVRRWHIGLAAVVLIGVIAWVGSWAGGAGSESQRRSRFAAELVSGQLNRLPLAVRSSDTLYVEQTLDGHLPFPMQIPPMAEGFELVGGARGVIDGKPVVCTRWVSQGREYSLYQFCPVQFDLPRPIRRQYVTADAAAVRDQREARVLMWTDEHCGYALVLERDRKSLAMSLPI